jgi:hypothetical protein
MPTGTEKIEEDEEPELMAMIAPEILRSPRDMGERGGVNLQVHGFMAFLAAE